MSTQHPGEQSRVLSCIISVTRHGPGKVHFDPPCGEKWLDRGWHPEILSDDHLFLISKTASVKVAQVCRNRTFAWILKDMLNLLSVRINDLVPIEIPEVFLFGSLPGFGSEWNFKRSLASQLACLEYCFKFPVSQLQIQQVFTRRNHPQTNGMSQVIS